MAGSILCSFTAFGSTQGNRTDRPYSLPERSNKDAEAAANKSAAGRSHDRAAACGAAQNSTPDSRLDYGAQE
ncbi:hypothetical protein BO70DRAFT_399878 [Aspergillus heteromorphus CBS 117.55]|uniref:Uncharacterized protein n=1 Tax=Aspergillus heteromorphus CBS 117.55 TaxID=1448321 RepID=A0A317V9G8_9EURO|nr:uncharacterized protein BO70DRAFT_399878 [Aspergillus heteromorphus CBS 117.55]PWY69678.1 hypothetical protein BO70DRAFT_399878 [Aspergillus heteromorphus CBS 117.55]